MAKKKEDVLENEPEKKPVFISQESIREIEKAEWEVKLFVPKIDIARLRVEKADKELSLLSANYTLKSKEKIELANRVIELEKELEEKKKN